jgi:hypothetical protein
MHLVCPSCRYQSKNPEVVECPRCAIDLEVEGALRFDRRPQKIRRNFNARRDEKRPRRRPKDESVMY